MKFILNVLVEELEKEINRQIVIDENIKLIDLCEYIIISMNGNKIPMYALENKNKIYYPFEIMETKNEKKLLDLTVKDLKLKKNNELCLHYNFDNCYYFKIIIENIIKEDNLENTKYFEVLSGKGYGITDDKYAFLLPRILTDNRKNIEKYYPKNVIEISKKTFNLEENNNRIKEYIDYKKDLLQPKSYIFNISLEGFNKDIKRKVCVNSNISVDSFCKKIITSMNGDLSHAFGLKINKAYLSDFYDEIELFYLGLKEKQRLIIVYDIGDNWTFKVTLSKIIPGYQKNDFEVLSGKGYGIIDDCGGRWGLNKILYEHDTSWGNYNINNFDLEKCNEKVKKIY